MEIATSKKPSKGYTMYRISKYISLAVICIFLGSFLTGCSKDSLSDYVKAHERTAEIQTGSQKMNVHIDFDYVTEGLTEEELIDISYYKTFDFEMHTLYDGIVDKEKYISDIYFNFYGRGYDMTLYNDGDKVYMKVPVVEKYIDFEKWQEQEKAKGYTHSFHENEEIWINLVDKWKQALSSNDIVQGQRDYVQSSDGQIKTTTYTIHVNKKQIDAITEALIETLENNTEFYEFINKNEELSDQEKVEITKEAQKFIRNIDVQSFNGVAHVDFDGRLVQETFISEMDIKNAQKGTPKHLRMEFTMAYDQLGEEINLEFPVVEEDMWLDANEKIDFSFK